MKVDRYVEPSEFDEWKRVAESMGFLYVASGPLVRSSYKVRLHREWKVNETYVCLRLVNTSLRMCCGGRAKRRRLYPS